MTKEFRYFLFHCRGAFINFAKLILWLFGYILFLPTMGWSIYPFAWLQKVAYERQWLYEGLDDVSWDNPRYMESFLMLNHLKGGRFLAKPTVEGRRGMKIKFKILIAGSLLMGLILVGTLLSFALNL